jgi:ketosteroid isomerase-like protein
MDLELQAYVERFNEAVRGGDWAAFAQGFTEDAVVEFENVPVPPMHGREAIAAGYQQAPPDDTITVVDISADGAVHDVSYMWDTDGTGGGRMRLTLRDGLVAHNVITLTTDMPAAR